MSCEYVVAAEVMGQLHPMLARKTLELALAAAGKATSERVQLTPESQDTVGYVGDHRIWIETDGTYGIENRNGYSVRRSLETTMAPFVDQAYIALGWKLALEAKGKRVELKSDANGTLTVEEV